MTFRNATTGAFLTSPQILPDTARMSTTGTSTLGADAHLCLPRIALPCLVTVCSLSPFLPPPFLAASWHWLRFLGFYAVSRYRYCPPVTVRLLHLSAVSRFLYGFLVTVLFPGIRTVSPSLCGFTVSMRFLVSVRFPSNGSAFLLLYGFLVFYPSRWRGAPATRHMRMLKHSPPENA